MYYYGARYYAAWIGRFISIDPLAEKFPQLTPCNYAGNKPVTYKDLHGLQSTRDTEVNTDSGSKQDNSIKSYYMNDQDFWIEGDSSFGYYAGNIAPSGGQGGYLELTKIDGTYYHKNTHNIEASFWNMFGANMVEKKFYSHAEESFNDELQSELIGLGVLKIGGLAFRLLRKAGGSLWKLPAKGIAGRGFVYEEMLEKLGHVKNLFEAKNFKTFDAFYKGKAWSIKTLNVLDKTYSEIPSSIYSKLKKYTDEMINFKGDTKLGQTLNPNDITSKIMELGIPKGATAEQVRHLNRAVKYAADRGIKINIRVVK